MDESHVERWIREAREAGIPVCFTGLVLFWLILGWPLLLVMVTLGLPMLLALLWSAQAEFGPGGAGFPDR